MKFFNKLKQNTEFIPFKDKLRPYYNPFISWLKYKLENKRFRSGGLEALFAARTAFKNADIFFWLDFGTLLGVIRDNQLLKHDTDIDLGILLKDHSPLIKETLEKHGFVFQKEFNIEKNGQYGLEERYLFNNIQLDIFYYSHDKDQMWCCLFQRKTNELMLVKEFRMKYSGFSTFKFKNFEWNIPSDYHQRLVDTYGENYTIPDTNWHTPNNGLNATTIETRTINE